MSPQSPTPVGPGLQMTGALNKTTVTKLHCQVIYLKGNYNKVSFLKEKFFPVNHLGQVNKTLFKLSFPEYTEMGLHVFSFDRVESVDSLWMILYMYDVGGGWWSDE